MTDRTIVEAVKREFEEALFAAARPLPGGRDAATTATWRWPTRCAARCMRRWIATSETYYQKASRTVCYLSAEFLLGPHLGNNLLNLGIAGARRGRRWPSSGYDLDDLLEQEEEPGLGNGGLGRLAACYMDSLATLADPGHRLRHPLRVRHLRPGDPRRLAGRDHRQVAAPRQPLGDRRGPRSPSTSASAATPSGYQDEHGRYRVRWVPERRGAGRGLRHPDPRLPRTAPPTCCGCGRPRPPSPSTSRPSTRATTAARSSEKVASETITKVLYPNDEPVAGQAAAPRAAVLLRLLLAAGHDPHPPADGRRPLDGFHEKYAVQLNDTHPAIAVAELMRLLVDEHGLGWDEAWEITRRTFAYTNHTLLPEALETWPVALFGRSCRATSRSSTRSTAASSTRCASRFPGDDEPRRGACRSSTRAAAASVRMAHLASVGSHAINGVAALHTRAAEARRAARLPRAVAGEVPQRHQRRHPAALPGPRQPAARRGS